MANRKGIFFTSDWHIGHSNSIKFDKRPFRDIDHMHEALIRNYNADVSENSICYFLGDHGMLGSNNMKKFMDRLNGTKVLVIGNHDKGMNSMYNAGFDVVLHGAKLIIAKKMVTLSHCPLEGILREKTKGMKGSSGGENWHGETRERHSQLTFPDMGKDHYHLHGHIHSRIGRDESVPLTDKQYDVGVPFNNYRPVHISKIEKWIAECEKRKLEKKMAKKCDFCDTPCPYSWCSAKQDD